MMHCNLVHGLGQPYAQDFACCPKIEPGIAGDLLAPGLRHIVATVPISGQGHIYISLGG